MIENASLFSGLCRHNLEIGIKPRLTCSLGPVDWQAVLYGRFSPYQREVVMKTSWKSEGSSEQKVNEALKSLHRRSAGKLQDTLCYHGRRGRFVEPHRRSASRSSLSVEFRLW
jgi:hypothetical protein